MREREIRTIATGNAGEGVGGLCYASNMQISTHLMKEAMLIHRTTTSLGPCPVQYSNTVQLKIPGRGQANNVTLSGHFGLPDR